MTSQRIYNKMKKIILISLLGLMLSALPRVRRDYREFHSNPGILTRLWKSKNSFKNRPKASRKKCREQFTARAEKEITRRLDFLNQLTTKIGNIKKLSAAQKTDLQSQIQAQIDGLNALQVKIKADTDNTTLRNGCQFNH